jgi:hypothetical protein
MNVLTIDRVFDHKANIYKLDLWKFDAIEPTAFQALSQLRYYLNLNGISSLSDDDAVVFARHPGILDLSGLKDVSDTALSHLAAKRGGLWLNGLAQLSDTAADALSKHEGDLYLYGIKFMFEDKYKVLQKHNIFLRCAKIEKRESALV